ncbi:MAG: hypothetical protein AAF798_16390 [Bacteroidota bacterium]
MKRNITVFTILALLQASTLYSQQHSTTAIYTASIDAVLNITGDTISGQPVLVLAPAFYAKNIKTYKGSHQVTYISGFGAPQKVWIGKALTYLDISPLTVTKGDILVIIRRSTVTYKSKRKWKLANDDKRFFYVTFRYSDLLGGYQLVSTTEGRYCPDTVD